MIAMALDTHAFVKTLTAAGMPEAQAEAVTTLVTAAREADTAQLVTKADLQITAAELKAEFKAELQREIGGVKTELQHESSSLRAELAATRSDLLKWMIGLVLGAVLLNVMTVVGAMVALIKVLGH